MMVYVDIIGIIKGIRLSIRNVLSKRLPMMVAAAAVLSAAFSPGLNRLDPASPSLPAPASYQLDDLTPEEKVGQLFLVTFNGSDTSAAAPIYDLIASYHLGGVILDRDNNNFENINQMPQDCWTLANGLQQIEYEESTSASSYYIPLFVGLSEEGDRSPYSEILAGLSPIPSQMSLGATWDPDLAQQIGEQVGRELSAIGINLLLGPSLDVLSNPNSGQSDLGVRSFGGDPYWVGKFGQAYIKGLHTGSLGNIIVVGKYFPGLGSSDRLPEDEVATVRKSLEQLKQIDLAPFFAVTGYAPTPEEAVDALLNSHIRYQGLQGNIRSTTRPISLDPQAFDLLMSLSPLETWRSEGGLVISDNLSSQAIRQLYDPTGTSFNLTRVALDAFIAGNDILFLGNIGPDDKPVSNHEIATTLDYFTNKYLEDQDFAARVDASVQRILDKKESMYPGFNISTVLTSEGLLSAMGSSTVSEIVARESATLINPSLTDLDAVIVNPPSPGERLVILTDTETLPVCDDCPEFPTLSTTSLEDAIIKLYGPLSGRQLVRANFRSYSFKDLTTLLDFPAESEKMVSDLYNANWILIAALNESSDRPYSNALSRLLAERQDLIRNKKIIVFALAAPYYLDATNISKISAYIALYNKLPTSLDVAARIIFKEFTSFPGSLPVSVPGINYDLISATSPDPERDFSIYLVSSAEADQTSVDTASTQTAPLYNVGDIINLFTGTIMDHNGHPVPDGTPVTFIVSSQGVLTSLPQVTTTDGSASTSYLIQQVNNISIYAESSLARSNIIEVNVLGALEGEESIETPVIPLPSQEPLATSTSAAAPDQVTPDQPLHSSSAWTLWIWAMIISVSTALAAYQVGAVSGLVRWGIRWGFSSLSGGLLTYIYLTLGLPGVSAVFPHGFTVLPLLLSVFAGCLIGWMVPYLYYRLVISKK
jgi:beta-N-acetylhexosaminidase